MIMGIGIRAFKENPILNAESCEIASPDSQHRGLVYLRNCLFGGKGFPIAVQD
jgi:hypothetical protein